MNQSTMQTLGKVQMEYRIQMPCPNFSKQQEKPGQEMDNEWYVLDTLPVTLKEKRLLNLIPYRIPFPGLRP